MSITRRNLLKGVGGVLGASAAFCSESNGASSAMQTQQSVNDSRRSGTTTDRGTRGFNGPYQGDFLDQIAFPLGGLGAGMICLEGTGALTKFSLHNRPNLTSEPKVFTAVSIKGSDSTARVLEGPVPTWKLRPQFPGGEWGASYDFTWGLPRFREAAFEARFPFATVHLKDDETPLEVGLTGWSPFSPGDANNSSLPVAAIEYKFVNRSASQVDAVFSFNTENFMATPSDQMNPNPNPGDRVRPTAGGFILYGPGAENQPWDQGYCAAWVDDPGAKVNCAWFRGEWSDSVQMIWNDIAAAKCYARDAYTDSASPGASIFVPFALPPGATKAITLHLAWHVPKSNLCEPALTFKNGKIVPVPQPPETYQPWYAGRFSSIDDVKSYWQTNYQSLRHASEKFTRTFYDSTLPPEAMEAAAANLSILKSPTILRQIDGRLWGWEGCNEEFGSCYGSSNHVWNYAQAISHLFPDLERTLRETELGPNLGKDGFQAARTALPIRPIGDTKPDGMPSAADGQLGEIIKAYREWRISGDTDWLRRLWPNIRSSLDYCTKTWDPKHRGWIEEHHLNTYDVEFWGPDSLHAGLYLGALKAAILMGTALGDDVDEYSELLKIGIGRMEDELFNGEYFFQKTEWKNLQTAFPLKDDPFGGPPSQYPEALELRKLEGPYYQYGQGCLSDGVLGEWQCLVCGVGDLLDRDKVESHLMAVYRHNLKKSLMDNADQGRSSFACGKEAGLLVCTWPKGGRPSLPVTYADEVWTGIEYQVASHLIALGKIDEGLDIVRSCRRRYDGRVRNPFDEVEAGHWYARAMSSYALLQAFSGARFDAVDKTLYLTPAIKGDFRCFLSTATGYGTVGVKNGQPFLSVVSGEIHYAKIQYIGA